ncbi:MAG: hypothetical protein IJ269_01760, partial [Bacteroidales bacterium]|nr:hypothetical protein [Bacteroidales bacterium]
FVCFLDSFSILFIYPNLLLDYKYPYKFDGAKVHIFFGITMVIIIIIILVFFSSGTHPFHNPAV